jgi:galactonate dehydratase
LKITQLETFVVGTPWKNWLFVKVLTDEGVSGIGEATSHFNTQPNKAAVHDLSRFVIGEDPLQPERLWQKLYK